MIELVNQEGVVLTLDVEHARALIEYEFDKGFDNWTPTGDYYKQHGLLKKRDTRTVKEAAKPAKDTSR